MDKTLDENGVSLLLISEYALDCQPYNTSYEHITWEDCTLREWLNDEFLNSAFSDDEQAMIPEVAVTADKNPNYSTDPGNNTRDRVFLLTIDEAEEYFTTGEDRKCVPTDYAIAQGADTSSNYTKDGAVTCWWWLRSPGGSQYNAADVSYHGSVSYTGPGVSSDSGCVRPAMRISLE